MSSISLKKLVFVSALSMVAAASGASAGPAANLEAFTFRSAESAVATVTWDRHAVQQAAAAAQPVRVRGFALAADLAVDLEIEPFSVTGPDTRFVLGRADGEDEPLDFDPRSISLFRGTVSGLPGSQVFFALGDRASTGFINLGPGRERYRIASKDAAGKQLRRGEISVFKTSGVATASQALPPGVPLCGVEDVGDTLPAPAGFFDKTTVVSGPGIKHLELAVETDFEFFQLFGDGADAAAYVVAMYAEVSAVYLRDVDFWVEVVFARIWDQPNDPFNGSDPLPEFRNYWNANMTFVARDIAQMFSGRRNYPFGGQASLSVLCSQTSGYSVVGYAIGSFPDPTKPSAYHYDISVTAHELGHNAGTGHTHDSANQIDECDDPLTTPQRGTIMSYCGQTFSGQNSNRDLYFHSIVQGNIDNHVASRSCMPDDCNLNAVDDALDISGATSADANSNGVPDECEDCNNNGTLDPADIAGASADVNGNNIPDECEPDCNANGIPDEWDVTQGTSTDAYGNFIPDECEADCNTNGISDYTEIQLNMDLDRDRNAVLDSCQDCDGDGTDDLTALACGHGLWIGSGETGSQLRRFTAAAGVVDAISSGAVVNEAQDLIISPSATVLVSSAADDKVLEFDLDGNYLGDLVAAGSGGLTYAAGLVISPSGTLLVASRDTHSVLSYDAGTGTFLGAFVAAGAGGLSQPFGLTFDRDGDLYVTTGTDEVLRYDGLTGAFIDAFVPAAANGSLSQPRGLTFKGDGNLLVASFGSDEVLEFDGGDGSPLGKWAQVGTATVLTQTSPWSVRVAPNGNIYMSRTGEDFGSGGGGSHDHGHLTAGTAGLHFTNAVIYEFDRANGNFVHTHIGGGDHGALFPTGFDFIPGWQLDCNHNLLPDSCDISSGASSDTDADGIPDECEVDCNANGTQDRLDVIPYGTSYDCNHNLNPDECDISSGSSTDGDLNGIPDECQSPLDACETVVDFDDGSAGGWINTGASTCSTGTFVVATPTQQTTSGVVTQPGGDHTTGGGNAWFSATNSSAGNADVDGGVCVTESPVYPIAADSDVSIWYFHGQRDAGADPSGDFFLLEISTDGGAGWSTLASFGDVTVNAAWTEAATTVSAGDNVQFRVQVSDGAATGDIVEGGVDDLTICSTAPICVVDADCDDGLYCNGDETCNAGSCQAGTAVVCDDGVGCTDDVCNETTDACDSSANDANCDDGAFCNGAETCDAALDCQAGTAIDCDDGVSCTDDACNEATDACDNTPDDGVCDNGTFCDGAETCDALLDCQAGAPVDCDDGVSCTVDACNEGTDSCDNTANDGLCDNGTFCDGAETCDALLDCQAGGDPCPGQACDEVGDACVACLDDGDCDDGTFCNGTETCNAGVCQAGSPVACDDGVGCTDDACNEGTDSCDNLPNDGLCDNGAFCDGAETCDAVNDCQPGTAPDCDDGVGCTDDACNEGTDACDHVADDANCDEGAFCNGAETCDAVNDCQVGTAPCTGGQTCNETDDVCEGGTPVTVTFTSIGGEDGWVRESNETSNVGGSSNSTGSGRRPIRPGDASSDRQYKSILSFDTSSLADGATLTEVRFRLTRGTGQGTSPFNGGFGNCVIDVNSGGFSGSTALQNSDFEAAATAVSVAVMPNAPNEFDVSEGILNAAGLAAINVTGTTQVRVYFEIDDNDDGGNDNAGFYSGDNSNSGLHPQLEVTYVP